MIIIALEKFKKSKEIWTEIRGTYGEFKAPGSEIPVHYIETYASLSSAGTVYTDLAKKLVPVREIFDVGDLNFDQILQRDIDDHRVATEIVPYLIENNHLARFFPPILAVIVPVENNEVSDYYENQNDNETDEEIVKKYGNQIRVTRYKGANDDLIEIAEMAYNPEKTRLVVIDGQHRSMALLAIKRTKDGDWGDRGRDFKNFYEDLADRIREREVLEKLENIQVPVTICFFPNNTKANVDNNLQTINETCRKLFVDVNKNARKPTKARTTLLDDSNLLSILTRSVISRIREIGENAKRLEYNLSLDVIEYDTPTDSTTPKRDLAFCSVQMLHEMVYWSAFGMDKYYDLSTQHSGRKGDPRLSRFKREILFDDKVPTSEIKEWGYSNFDNEFEIDNIYKASQEKLSSLYLEGWGKALIIFFEELYPYKSHYKAVNDLKAAHDSESGHANLAYKALFEGQSILWNIERYTEHQKEMRKNGLDLAKSMIEKANEVVQDDFIPEFKLNRAKWYFDADNPTSVQIDYCNSSFEVYITQAFQIGTLMAFAFLKKELDINDPEEFHDRIIEWINIWNKWVSSNNEESLTTFSRKYNNSVMNKYPRNLTPNEWFWFSYFTLEILNTSDESFEGQQIVQIKVLELRKKYLSKIKRNIRKQKEKAGEETSEKEINTLSHELLKNVLKQCFGLNKSTYDEWQSNNFEIPDSENGEE